MSRTDFYQDPNAPKANSLEIALSALVRVSFSNPEHMIAYDDGEVRQEFSICFTAKPVGGKLQTSSESKEVGWIDPEGLANLNIHPSIWLRIERALEGEPYYT
ncbi:hypothetical protein GFY24_18700 [Nocardia sp. SYP-A9097]|uniref:hypothetical protein n=1 Tax=Nocardia sp. SYP-A9097 TaxID=2663237 RepID=UPI0013268C2B|nr:hypothetical protein [Nocardia sp. SYP-A9097]MRH89452.1 hypothetical protein [Nocardia sp. SYP-A9097]